MLSVEACVIAFERRSHLGPLVEGRPGPSDDDDGDAGVQFFLSGFFPSSQG